MPLLHLPLETTNRFIHPRHFFIISSQFCFLYIFFIMNIRQFISFLVFCFQVLLEIVVNFIKKEYISFHFNSFHFIVNIHAQVHNQGFFRVYFISFHFISIHFIVNIHDQVHNHNFFRAGEVFQNEGTSTYIFGMYTKGRPQGKMFFWSFFSQILLKLHFK